MSNLTVVKMVFGSHLYGLDTPESDTDYKGVVLPTSDQVIMQEADFHMSSSTGDDTSKNEASDVDEEMFSIMKFLKLAAKGETVAIDMLHAPDSAIIESSPLWNRLVANRHVFYTKNMKAYIGYVRKQAAKYGVKGSKLAVIEKAIAWTKDCLYEWDDESGTPYKNIFLTVGDIIDSLPIGEYSKIVETEHPAVGKQRFYEIAGRKFQDTLKLEMFLMSLTKIYDSYGARAQAAKDNEGIDWKAISHALRAGYQAKYIYLKGGFEYPLPETQYLLDVKQGKLDYLKNVQPELEALVDEVLHLAEKSSYPEKVNMKEVRSMIHDVHSAVLKTDKEWCNNE